MQTNPAVEQMSRIKTLVEKHM